MSRNHFWTTALLVAALAWLCGCSTAPSHLAYVTLSSGQVAAYRVDNSSGLLTAIPGSPYTAGVFPTSITVHPSGKFAYVANTGEGDISLFLINAATGALREILPRIPAGTNPTSLAVRADGNELFVANSGSGTISVFSISSGNANVIAISGSPFACGTSPVAL
ncbi:MAG TPA: beta-propeller fold lactonase family protein, partial [Terriglobales bacterium]|nr:beta-propeller fold lactonase family protein [Terriglobales bacterium]